MAYGGSQPRSLIETTVTGYTTATATQDLSCIFSLHHSSWQCWILNPLSKARDQTCKLMVPSQTCFPCAMMGTLFFFFKLKMHSNYSYTDPPNRMIFLDH